MATYVRTNQDRVPFGPVGPLSGSFYGTRFTSESSCKDVPPGDPYRTSGNFCQMPSGEYASFDPDGTLPIDACDLTYETWDPWVGCFPVKKRRRWARGLGDSSCSGSQVATQSGDCIDINYDASSAQTCQTSTDCPGAEICGVSNNCWLPAGAKPGTGGGSGGGGSGSSTGQQQASWWQQLITATTAGVTAGAAYGQGQKPPPKPAPTLSWYQQPIGIVGILVGVGLTAYLIAK